MAMTISVTLFIILIRYSFANVSKQDNIYTKDMTSNVFGSDPDFVPAAFGDFNSDQSTDLFVIKNNKKTVEILLGSDSEPFLKHDVNRKLECSFDGLISSVVPGDFDGDALLDLLVTVNVNNKINSVRILWGDLTTLNCSQANESVIRTYGQPLAFNYNEDMVTDLFGEDQNRNKTFWVFKNIRSVKPKAINMLENSDRHFLPLKYPHSNAFIDLNRDSSADLYLSVEDNSYDVWLYNKEKKSFEFGYNIPGPPDGDSCKKQFVTGQTLFMDVQLDGELDHVVPVCFTKDCMYSEIYVYSLGKWHNLGVNFYSLSHSRKWNFIPPKASEVDYFANTITLHSGDYNKDGYPDLLATLQRGDDTKSFLLKNVKCNDNCDGFPRTFNVLWSALESYNNGTTLGVFFDFNHDSLLDILFVHGRTNNLNGMHISALKNDLNYDTNFLKVIVLNGLTYTSNSNEITALQKMKKIYCKLFPGQMIWYITITYDGNRRAGLAAQLPQSAYFSLQLPFISFGLDNTAFNMDNENKTNTKLGPNSQLTVIPKCVNCDQQCRPKHTAPQESEIMQLLKEIIKCTVILFIGVVLGMNILIFISTVRYAGRSKDDEFYWMKLKADYYEHIAYGGGVGGGGGDMELF